VTVTRCQLGHGMSEKGGQVSLSEAGLGNEDDIADRFVYIYEFFVS
jgi:hypothetical protein